MIYRVWKAWDNFWFNPIDLYAVSLMRMCLSVIWLAMYGVRLFNFDVFYSESGVLPVGLVGELLPSSLNSVLPFYFESEFLLLASHWLFLILILGMVLGLFGRSLTWLVFILHVGFLQRNPGIVYGADLFSTFWLLGLSFVQHNRHFSVLNLWRNKITDRIQLPQLESDVASTIGVRLIQVQICFVYAFTGIEKLKGESWWDGTAIWHVVNMKDLVVGDFTFLYHVPLLVAALTISTLIFEVYFPAAMLNRALRPYWLWVGVAFHISTALFMGIPYFALVMMAPYLLFIDSKALRLYGFRLYEKLRLRLKPS